MLGGSLQRLAVGIIVVLVVAGFAQATVTIAYDSGSLYQTQALTGYSTYGSDMVGMTVTVYYVTGGSETASWVATGSQTGGAIGTGWSLSEAGDTFAGLWTLTNSAGAAISRIVIDAVPGDMMFDIYWSSGYGTDGSANGWTFEPYPVPVGLDILATYRNQVALTGQAPVGDLWGQLQLDFTSIGGLATGASLTFMADTDMAVGTIIWTDPPAKAVSPMPSNGLMDASISGILVWSNGGGATSYDVYLGTSSALGTADRKVSGSMISTYASDTLEYSRTYYWRIDSTNSYGTTTGDVWSFTTAPPEPGKAISPMPSNGLINVSVSASLAWSNGGRATSYDVYFGTSSALGAADRKVSGVTGTTYTPDTLEYSRTYYWRIDSANAYGTTTGDVWGFTTTPPEPGKAISPTPSNGLTNVSVSASLAWSNGGRATSYDVYFGTSSSLGLADRKVSGITNTAYSPGTLAYGRTYYWRIDSTNTYGITTGDVWNFTTAPPAVPVKAVIVTPFNGLTNVSISVSLVWSNGGGATSYDVYFGTSSTLGTGDRKASSTTNVAYAPGTLAYSRTYYWRIDSINAYGTTTGNVWNFTTAPLPVPGKAISPAPANGATNVSVSASLAWSNGGGATSYDVYLGTSSALGAADMKVTNTTGTTYTPGTLAYSRTYYWRIDSKNAYGTTVGNVWSFTTLPLPVPGKAISPVPSNGLTDVSVSASLAWSNGGGATSYDVYFGTSSALGLADMKVSNTAGTTYTPGTLVYSRTYYWRIDSKNAYGTTVGNVWTFVTKRYPTISGHVRTGAGTPVIGVTLTTSDGLSCGNGDGGYVLQVPYGWSGTITPSRSGYRFTPASMSYNNVTLDQLEQNYIAELIPVVLASVVPSSGTAGAVVTLGGSYLGDAPGHVLFGGVPASVILEWTQTSIRCIVPAGAVTGNVVVVKSDQSASNGIAFTVTVVDILYVSNLADANSQNGTIQYPFKTIAGAIAAAVNGAIVEVDDGVYTGPENRGLDTLGKRVTVRSANGPASCIIDCNGLDRAFYIHSGEDANTIIDGFTIINGCDGSIWGSAISCMGASPTIRNCVIRDNGGFVAGIYCDASGARIENCVVADNTSLEGLAGIYVNLSEVNIVNCTIADNTSPLAGGISADGGLVAISNSIVWGNLPAQIDCSLVDVTYSCVQDWTAGGEGNISVDPLFADAADGDYHLLPASLCIDAGDPASDFSQEPLPNGGRVDMGAYGNTSQATWNRLSAEYQVIAKRRVGRTVFDYDCKVVLKNNLSQSIRVTQFQLQSVPAGMSIIDANASGFVDIGAGGSVTSGDTCTLRVDRSQAIAVSQVQWQVTYEVLGTGQTMQLTSLSILTLDPKAAGDMTGDDAIDSTDLMILSEQWLSSPGDPSADINGDGSVNFADFAAMAGNWMH